MRVDLLPGVVLVRLSRRNCLCLAAKLVQGSSARTLVSGAVYDENEAKVEGTFLAIVAETDAVHYSRREPAGLVHPVTEEIVRAMMDEMDAGTTSLEE